MLSGNPITSLNNNSFDGVNEDLEMLDISNFRLHYFEYGCLDSLPHLRSLKLTAYSHLEHFNIPHLLRHHYNIRQLWIEAPQPFTRIVKKGSGPTQEMQTLQLGNPTDLQREMEGHLPSKLTNITFSGPQFTNLNERILKVSSSILQLIDINLFYSVSGHAFSLSVHAAVQYLHAGTAAELLQKYGSSAEYFAGHSLSQQKPEEDTQSEHGNCAISAQ